ncbi:hypothetical protein ACLB2K_000469 [Fragaria x ananassa]
MEDGSAKEKKTEVHGGQNVDLPPEMIDAILSRVPVKPLCRFKLVSKSWQSLISDPDFVSNYSKTAFENKDILNNVDGLVAAPTEVNFVYNNLRNDALDYRDHFVGSCYGLFLCEVHSKPDIRVLSLINPVTKESKTLPNTPKWRLPRKPYANRSLCGLGFDHSTNEYKVIDGQYTYSVGIVFSVYTLQTDSWRQIDYLFPYHGQGLLDRGGILVNGGVHWLVDKVTDGASVIISFLLAEEEVKEMALPHNAPESPACIRLGAFRNSLCVTFLRRDNEFWVMKEYGVRDSWTKMQVSQPYFELSHSGFWTESHDLMLFNRSSLVMYNFNEGTSWDLSISDMRKNDDIFSFGIYVESLPSVLMANNNVGGVEIEDDRIHSVTSSNNYSLSYNITSAIVMLACTILVMLHIKAFH